MHVWGLPDGRQDGLRAVWMPPMEFLPPASSHTSGAVAAVAEAIGRTLGNARVMFTSRPDCCADV